MDLRCLQEPIINVYGKISMSMKDIRIKLVKKN